MNNLDRYIIDDLSPDIELPQSYHDIISNTLKNKQLRKRYRLKKLIHIIISIISSIFLTSGMVFAGYTVYEKVWKAPIEFNNVQEFQEKDYQEKEIVKEEMNNTESTSIYNIIDLAQNIIKNLGYDYAINESNLKEIAENSEFYYEIVVDNLSIIFSKTGTFQNLFDNNLFYDFSLETEQISEVEAKKYANTIYNNIISGINNKYIIGNIQEMSAISRNKQCKEWKAVFYQTYDGIVNSYDVIEIRFVIIDNNLKIKSILTKNSGYTFKNDDIEITKEQALKIAQNCDRKISILDINNIEAEIAIKDMNSFVYAQLNSLGTEDEIKHEPQPDGSIISYDAYYNEKILRKVWNVKINYLVDKEKQRNISESGGRNYYVDAKTGEIIGGAWEY